MFRKNKRSEKKINNPKEESCALSYPVGRAAEMLGISKRTLLRHAEAIGLAFQWDGRGRRVKVDDIQKLLGKMDGEISRKDTWGAREIPTFPGPTQMRIWQKWGGGIVEKRSDFIYYPEDGILEEVVKHKFGAGKYTIRCIEDGILKEESYKIKIWGVPRHFPFGKKGRLWDKWVMSPHRFR